MDVLSEYHRAVDPCLRGPVVWSAPESVPGAPASAHARAYTGSTTSGTLIVIVRWDEPDGTTRYDGTLSAGLVVVHLRPSHALLFGIRAEAEGVVPVTKS